MEAALNATKINIQERYHKPNTINVARAVARSLSLGAGAHGERGARAYNGGLGAKPPAGSRGRAPGGGSGGLRPPETESLLPFRGRKEAAKCFIWCILETHKNTRINDVLIRID